MESKDGRDSLTFSLGNPSQWKRDERKRQEFLARKVSAADVKKEVGETDDKKDEVTIQNPLD